MTEWILQDDYRSLIADVDVGAHLVKDRRNS
jgi:hypothetical protein